MQGVRITFSDQHVYLAYLRELYGRPPAIGVALESVEAFVF